MPDAYKSGDARCDFTASVAMVWFVKMMFIGRFSTCRSSTCQKQGQGTNGDEFGANYKRLKHFICFLLVSNKRTLAVLQKIGK